MAGYVVRHKHFQTWTFGRAVPACDPGGKKKVSRQGQLVVNKDKVTCHECLARLAGAEAVEVIGAPRGQARGKE